MKKSFITLVIISGFLTSSFLVTNCNSKPKHEQNEHDAMKKDSTEVLVYACSMHPDVTGKEGDKCSKCGMKLEVVKSTDSTKTQHVH